MLLLPQFVDHVRGHIALQTLILGATQISIALTLNAVIVLSAGNAATFLVRRPAGCASSATSPRRCRRRSPLRILTDRSRAVALRP
jgi:hypothetical protein